MKRLLLLLLFCTLPAINGCGGHASVSTAPAPMISVWSGTYTGILNFNGCPSTGACTGNSVTLTLNQQISFTAPTDFSEMVNFSGTDTTTTKELIGSGTAAYVSPASSGPGNLTLTAYGDFGEGGTLFFFGSGSSTASSPVLIDTIQVKNSVIAGTETEPGAENFGTLTRQQ